MTKKASPAPGLPTRKQILEFIKDSPTPAGKREIARAFGLKGQEKIQLKALLRAKAERTITALWDAVGSLIELFTPTECANYFKAAGYEPD